MLEIKIQCVHCGLSDPRPVRVQRANRTYRLHRPSLNSLSVGVHEADVIHDTLRNITSIFITGRLNF